MGPLPLKGPAETDQNIIDLILKEDYTEAFFNCLQKIAKNESTQRNENFTLDSIEKILY